MRLRGRLGRSTEDWRLWLMEMARRNARPIREVLQPYVRVYLMHRSGQGE